MDCVFFGWSICLGQRWIVVFCWSVCFAEFQGRGMDHRLADVEGADTLRWEDQQKLSAYIEGQNYFQMCKTIWSS
jgi:hypothetical protein